MKHIGLLIGLSLCTGTAAAQAPMYNNTIFDEPSSDIEVIRMNPSTIQGTEGRPVDSSHVRVGPGMERIQMQGMNFVLPKGTRIYRDAGTVKFEDISEYLARNLDAINQRLDAIVTKQDELEQKLQDLAQDEKELRSGITNSTLGE